MARQPFRVCEGHVTRSEQIKYLEDSISDYLQLIRTFENDRAEMQRRRKTAHGLDATQLDHQLRVNQRGLDLLDEALAKLRAQLEEVRNQRE